MSHLYRLNKNINRLIAALILVIGVSSAAHAIETKGRQHDDRHCAVCAAVDYCASGLVSAAVLIPAPPLEIAAVDLIDQQSLKSPVIVQFSARAPPQSLK